MGGFAFEVGELVVAAVGPFGDAKAFGSLDVEAAAEEGDEAPVVTLFDLGRDGVVVALGALDLLTEESAGGANGHIVMAVALFVEEAGGAVFLFGIRAGDDEVAADLIPGAVGFEGPAEVVEPGFAVVAICGAVEEDDVKNLGEVGGVFRGSGELVDEGVAVGLGEEGLKFVGFGDSSEEVEVEAAGEGGAVGGLGRGNLFVLPFLGGEVVDDAGGIEGGVGENELDGRFDFESDDPGFEGVDFFRGELLLGRHVGVGIDLDDLVERALFGVAGDEGGFGFAAFDGGGEGAEVKPALLFYAAVALGAVLLNDGVDLPGKWHAQAQAEEKEEEGAGRWHEKLDGTVSIRGMWEMLSLLGGFGGNNFVVGKLCLHGLTVALSSSLRLSCHPSISKGSS